jgi:hypothetical protein
MFHKREWWPVGSLVGWNNVGVHYLSLIFFTLNYYDSNRESGKKTDKEFMKDIYS